MCINIIFFSFFSLLFHHFAIVYIALSKYLQCSSSCFSSWFKNISFCFWDCRFCSLSDRFIIIASLWEINWPKPHQFRERESKIIYIFLMWLPFVTNLCMSAKYFMIRWYIVGQRPNYVHIDWLICLDNKIKKWMLWLASILGSWINYSKAPTMIHCFLEKSFCQR